ncbi:hypothetical protein MalM25_17640 [Planctomycetes bacterium MalM25]|nr:hypothetical protein MalM25_17640 [Planctomycetes bacterium MalM25]
MKLSSVWRSWACASLGLWLLACSGCSEYESTVNGVVRFDGNTLDHGAVTYVSEGGAVIATGSIASDGDYWVEVASSGGLPAGEYQVKVTCRGPAVPSPRGGPPAPGKSLIPRKYTRGHTSGWKFTVEPGSNTIDLELSSAK